MDLKLNEVANTSVTIDAGERLERLARLTMRLLGMPIVSVDLDIAVEKELGVAVDAEIESGRPAEGPLLAWVRRTDAPAFFDDVRRAATLAVDPLVVAAPGIRSVAAWPLRDVDGSRLGTLLVADCVVRSLEPEDRTLMGDVARGIELELRAVRAAMLDRLTGLLNRRGFDSIAPKLIAHSERYGQPLTLMSIDLNGFKPINDQYGHAEGDRALRLFAEILTTSLRSSDVIARIGGDEFVVLMTPSKEGSAEVIAERLRAASSDLRARGITPYLIEFSAGIVEHATTRRIEFDELVAQADAAMYLDKVSRRHLNQAPTATPALAMA